MHRPNLHYNVCQDECCWMFHLEILAILAQADSDDGVYVSGGAFVAQRHVDVRKWIAPPVIFASRKLCLTWHYRDFLVAHPVALILTNTIVQTGLGHSNIVL